MLAFTHLVAARLVVGGHYLSGDGVDQLLAEAVRFLSPLKASGGRAACCPHRHHALIIDDGALKARR